MPIEVRFYEAIEDERLKYAVIIAKADGKWVFCKHRERATLEIPGGHREAGEAILDTAKRELYEETGATDYTIRPVCVYAVLGKDGGIDGREASYGMLFCAEILNREAELHSEIEKIFLLDALPSAWTYPLIQPKLIEEAERRGLLT